MKCSWKFRTKRKQCSATDCEEWVESFDATQVNSKLETIPQTSPKHHQSSDFGVRGVGLNQLVLGHVTDGEFVFIINPVHRGASYVLHVVLPGKKGDGGDQRIRKFAASKMHRTPRRKRPANGSRTLGRWWFSLDSQWRQGMPLDWFESMSECKIDSNHYQTYRAV